MRTIIIGAGKMGFSMAQLLSSENHDVVVIDTNPERQKVVNDNLDVKTIIGSGIESSILQMAEIQETDMLLALTESDELNMMACIIAKNFGVNIAIARVRNTDYLESYYTFLQEKLGIDLLLNPERITANEAFNIIENPDTRSVDYFAEGKVQVISLSVPASSFLVGKKMMELPTEHNFNIVSILRGKSTLVPHGQDYILADDYISVMAKTSEMPQVKKMLGYSSKKVANICILGGGHTGFYLAKMLERSKISHSVKLIEQDLERARKLSEDLDKTLVLHGNGGDLELMEEENIKDSDVLVAVTNDDQINLLSALIAKNMGVKVVLTQLKRPELMFLAKKIGVDVVLSPRVLASGAVLKYIRKGNIASVALMNENQAEMLEFVIQPDCKLIGQPLMDIMFPKSAIIGVIARQEKVVIPDGYTVIEPLDRVIVFTLADSIHDVERLFS